MFLPAPLLAIGGLLEAITQNDGFGKLCLVVLVCLSVYSLYVGFTKFIELKMAQRHSAKFQNLSDSEGSWEMLFLAAKKYPSSPLAVMFRETYVECRLEKWFADHEQLELEGRLSLAQDTIASVLDRTIAEEENRLQAKLGFLSLASTLAPFIGLLGTVWGILVAFMAIGSGGSAALSNLAPGISTALVTTIFGLFAAIPAVIAHNYLSARAQDLSMQMERFSRDLENAVRKQIARERGIPR